ncbi:hypothetical protein [Mesorhizobium sp. STM 4661]|uniref:hypothetical protein n=1 Tax=Mesorhizobium sp. STM 4661 TaxID=1297570 RepID=UPI0002BE3E09|nr:hypothetical protein [Mesorhizobium sp. STM 4661]CCV10206.1 hypothetical protein MESS4_130011 [Mesorhizobium sp. STM 4661]
MADWRHGKKDRTDIGIAPVTIDDNAWIGMGVTILKGVTIGAAAVVGAASAVTKNVEPFTTVVGDPARVINSTWQHAERAEIAAAAKRGHQP